VQAALDAVDGIWRSGEMLFRPCWSICGAVKHGPRRRSRRTLSDVYVRSDGWLRVFGGPGLIGGSRTAVQLTKKIMVVVQELAFVCLT